MAVLDGVENDTSGDEHGRKAGASRSCRSSLSVRSSAGVGEAHQHDRISDESSSDEADQVWEDADELCAKAVRDFFG